MKEVTMSRVRVMRWLIAAFLLSLAWIGVGSKPVMAAEAKGETYSSVSDSHSIDYSHILSQGDTKATESGSSGVEKLDEAADRTNKLVTWVCAWVGGLMALFGIIWAAINQASHNSEGRNQGIIVGAIGIVVAFAPQITNMILGK